MSDKLKPEQPPRAPFDSQFPTEESHVRSRHEGARSSESGLQAATPDRRPEQLPESVGERTARIDRKMSIAMRTLERLPATDSRARLLASAMMRRDEVLLDAVLAQIANGASVPPSSRRG